LGVLAENDVTIYRGKLALVQYQLEEYRDALSNGLKALENWRLFTIEYARQLLFICLHIMHQEKNDEALKLIDTYTEMGKDFRLYLIHAEILIESRAYKECMKSIVEGLQSLENLKDEHFLAVHLPLLSIENSKKYKFEVTDNVKENSYVQVENVDGYFYIGSGKPLEAEHITEDDSSAVSQHY